MAPVTVVIGGMMGVIAFLSAFFLFGTSLATAATVYGTVVLSISLLLIVAATAKQNGFAEFEIMGREQAE